MILRLSFLALICSLLQETASVPLHIRSKGDFSPYLIDPFKYLENFGWLSEQREGAPVTQDSAEFSDGLKRFQTFAGLPATGALDRQTLSLMGLPRCGRSDTEDLSVDVENVPADRPLETTRRRSRNPTHHRTRRYVLQGTRWKGRELRYQISRYTEDMPKEAVDKVIASAFYQWESVANVSFFPVHGGKVNIDIRFERGYHGDEEVFDGPGGTTAHAYFPIYGGAVHFDEDEDWTENSATGVNLYQVATHEIGHALGLEHSNVQESVMAPFYRNFKRDFTLFRDDILAIQALYGKRLQPSCDIERIHAATRMGDGNVYLFANNFVYTIQNGEESVSEVPTDVSVLFPGLPSHLDGAVTRWNGVSYFFKGEEYWRWSNMSADTGFPKRAEETFPGIPFPIEAVVTSRGSLQDEELLFMKERAMFRFNGKRAEIDSLYRWKGVPTSGIDAAVGMEDPQGNMYILLFKGREYWKLNEKTGAVFISDPPYPRQISKDLFGCRF